jgi:Dolichyl-phosphate-mannose-protein mannosyltransferase
VADVAAVTGTADRNDPESPRPAARVSAPEQRPRWVLPTVAALCALALVVRALIATHSGLWRDEALFLFVAREPSWGAMLDFLSQHESHPPLFYAVMRVWLSLVGDTDATALAVPVVLGAALIPVLYHVGARLFSWRVGLIAAAFATVSPVTVQYAAMVRPYSALPLLALLAAYALVRAVDHGGLRRWAGYAATMLALVYTHNWAWLVLVAHWVALAACLWRGVARPRAAVLREWCLAQAAIGLAFLPWLPSFLNQAAHAGHAPLELFAPAHTPADVFATVIVIVRVLLAGTLVPAGGVALSAAAVAWALVVSGIGVLSRRPARVGGGALPADAAQALVALVIVPAAAVCAASVVSARSDMLQLRCLVTLAPLLLLVVAYGVERLRASGQGRLAAVAVAALLAAYASLLAPLYAVPRSHARELARDLAAKTEPSDLILIAPEFIASSFNRYYQPATEQIDFPALERIGAMPFDRTARRFGDPAALAAAERRLAASHAAGRRVWLIVDVGSTTCNGASCDSIATHSDRFVDVGYARATQLREYLGTLYGPATGCDADTYAAAPEESLEVCLFAPR